LVVLFGLKGILKSSEKAKHWNHENGLMIKWKKPQNLINFKAYKTSSYKYKEWQVINAKNHKIKVVLWPNHPSRAPFSKNFIMWEKSVHQYLLQLKLPNKQING